MVRSNELYQKNKAKEQARLTAIAVSNTRSIAQHFGSTSTNTNNNNNNNNNAAQVNNRSDDNNDTAVVGEDNTNNNNNNNNNNNRDEGNNDNNNDRDNEGNNNNNYNDNNNDEGDINNVDDNTATTNDYWPPHVMDLFKSITSTIDKDVDFSGRGATGQYRGKFPKDYKGLIKISDDPISFYDTDDLLKMEQFAMPHFLVWLPEAIHKGMYQNGRPSCPWHKATSCVCLNGWCQSPRRGHTRTRILLSYLKNITATMIHKN